MSTIRRFRITINGKVYEVEAEELGTDQVQGVSQPPVPAPIKREAPVAPSAAPVKEGSGDGLVPVTAPLPGGVLDVKVGQGDTVQVGQIVAILEAMKMENEIPAPISGTVQEILVQKGSAVSQGDVLLVIRT